MFQVIENWQKRKIINSMGIEDLVNRVKNPTNDFKVLIDKARSYDRKSKEYTDIKKTLPCFTTAFKFRGYINKSNVSKPTGYLYIDIDDVDTINLNHPSVVFYCKSVSGHGYSIIVGVMGVTDKNIKSVTLEVAKELDIKLDLAAISPDRLTVISYDINAYYNPEHTYFLYEDGVLKSPHYNDKHILIYSNECNGGKIRKDNLEEITRKYNFNGESTLDFIGNKVKYFKLITPYKDIDVGRRNLEINKLCYFMRGLNMDVDKNIIKSYLNSINVAKCTPPLSDTEITSIVDSVFRIPEINLEPNTERRFLYNPDYDLTTKEKRQENIRLITQFKVNNTKTELLEIINKWNKYELGKITQTKLAKQSGKNIKTIEKYYKEFKIEINLVNSK